MAVQFPCPSCNQPIEVDDEWASQQVTCPYCRRMVTAPAESTVQTSAPPAAAPAGPAPPDSSAGTTVGIPYTPAGHVPTAEPPARNRAGTWGFVFAIAAIAMIVLGMIMMAVRFMPLVESMSEGKQDPAATQREMQKLVAEEPARFLGPALALLGGIACALVGVVLSGVGLARPQSKKGLAIAGLIISGLCLSCFCLGMLGPLVRS